MLRTIVAIVFVACLAAGQAWAALPAEISSIMPENGATISTGPTITVVFNTDMARSTITRDSFYLTDSSSNKISGGTVGYLSTIRTATLTYPAGTLRANNSYILVLSPGRNRITKSNGSAINAGNTYNEYHYSTTGSGAPTIVDTDPSPGANGVALTASVNATFSEGMDVSTLTTSNFTVTSGSSSLTVVQGTIAYDAAFNTATFTPSPQFKADTLYTVTLKTSIKNTAGAGLTSQYVFTFRTAVADAKRPRVNKVSPADGATSIALDAGLTAKFNEPMAPDTITSTSFTLKTKSGVSVLGMVGYNATTHVATFTPIAPLVSNTSYQATISTAVTDEAGNALAFAKIWNFTTRGALPVSATGLNAYCQVPPFVTSGAAVLKPNLLLILDNSGSMAEFAYKGAGLGGGINRRDTSYDSNSSYYGYFRTDKMYSYKGAGSSGYFSVDSRKALVLTDFWSGNFLNWLTMRKVDLARKVLVGGKASSRNENTQKYLLPYNESDRDFYKSYGTKSYVVDQSIYVCGSPACSSSEYSATYNLKVEIDSQPEGILHQMQDRINFGVMLFNPGYQFEDNASSADGGYLAAPLGSAGDTLVSSIENSKPSSWTPLAESFYEATRYFRGMGSAYNSPANYADNDPVDPAHWCVKNFVMIVTDGESTKDQNLPGTAFEGNNPVTDDVKNFNVKGYMDKIAGNEGTASKWDLAGTSDGSFYLPGVALWAHNTDLRSSTMGRTEVPGVQSLSTYVVYAFDDNPTAREMLMQTAKYGGFEDSKMSEVSLPDSTLKWDANGDGVPDTYYEASQGDQLERVLVDALRHLLGKVSSGTSASTVNNRGESGANLFQAFFYPKKSFGSNDLSWTGELQNMWYYLDPAITTSSIREDTINDQQLDLKADYKVEVEFNTSKSQTLVNWYQDTTGLGAFTLKNPDNPGSPDDVKALWRAGSMLHKRSATDRTIKTALGSYNGAFLNSSNPTVSRSLDGFTSFHTDNRSGISDHLNVSDLDTADKVINYIRGEDYPSDPDYRSRTATVTVKGRSGAPDADITGVWKLGDIISSTPQAQTSRQLNSYDAAYNDSSYSQFYQSAQYGSRNMVYTAANDGMLHAFRAGKVSRLPYNSATPSLIAKIEKLDDTLDLGDEEWAFIPRNALPYLKYLGEPAYNHLYYVNNTVTLVDASINRPADTAYACSQANYWNCQKKTTYSSQTAKTLDADNTSWRTVLIGGMGLGGASRDYRGYCNKADGSVPNNPVQETRLDCVKSPIAGTGLSSFFALDVTDPKEPKFMWEFSDAILPPADKGLGFSTSGPAVVRISAREPSTASDGAKNLQKNGRWFSVFATGPSGPIDTGSHQFKGRSDNTLKVYVVDMHPDMSAGWKKGTNYWVLDSGIADAFAGDLSDSVIDADRSKRSAEGFYSDDVVYLGYTSKSGTTPVQWTEGGVLRLLTNDSLNPAEWTLSKVIDGIGPVTSNVTKLQDAKGGKMWLLFGSGRYFFKDASGHDDPASLRHLLGVQDDCYDGPKQRMKQGCPASNQQALGLSDLEDQSTSVNKTLGSTKKGWYITLDPAGEHALGAQMKAVDYDAERVVTNTTVASNGVVFFTTFKPTSDICSYGGATLIWMVDFMTGGVPPASTMKGKMLVQLSSGEFVTIDVATATNDGGDATQKTRQQRRLRSDLVGFGLAGGKGGSVQSAPRPVRKILHIMEK